MPVIPHLRSLLSNPHVQYTTFDAGSTPCTRRGAQFVQCAGNRHPASDLLAALQILQVLRDVLRRDDAAGSAHRGR